jgi:hypothetical protein
MGGADEDIEELHLLAVIGGKGQARVASLGSAINANDMHEEFY